MVGPGGLEPPTRPLWAARLIRKTQWNL